MGLVPPPQKYQDENYPQWRAKGIYYLRNAIYQGILDMLNFIFTLNLIYLFVYDTKNLNLEDKYLMDIDVILALTLQAVFLTDMIANFIVVPPKALREFGKIFFFEILLQLYFVLALYDHLKFRSDYMLLRHELQDLGIVFTLRNIRLMKYTRIIKDVEFIWKTIFYLSKPIMTRFFFIYLVFYEYAYVGMILFNGKLTF